jgi:hypothetical protein
MERRQIEEIKGIIKNEDNSNNQVINENIEKLK